MMCDYKNCPLLANHEARLESLEHKMDTVEKKMDKVMWLLATIIAEVPIACSMIIL